MSEHTYASSPQAQPSSNAPQHKARNDAPGHFWTAVALTSGLSAVVALGWATVDPHATWVIRFGMAAGVVETLAAIKAYWGGEL